eukprot:TRINITY_DN26654_c0_g1_i1.p1 TRINITY_DN26654_c0_g1~~TRINITY_DN26654_c0_g1_i1.p1  ORF type:complete len:314 (+),score=57.40 TRINITY_DN26654_c0_g1_i1:59-943(+)
MASGLSTSNSCSACWGGQVAQLRMPRGVVTCGTRPQVRAFLSEDVRLSLLQALSAGVANRTQQALYGIAKETVKYLNLRRSDATNLEEALMTVPDLETIPYHVVRREKEYEIREVESYLLAETLMPGKRGFDFFGSSQGFNTLADYIFGKNKRREKMEMTTPVVVQRGSGQSEKMEMTTPVVSQQAGNQWKMSFLLESTYDEGNLPVPEDSRVTIRRVPARVIAAMVFSGFVSDDVVTRRQAALRKALQRDSDWQVKGNAVPEVAQYNPPFTAPFLRRNEIWLEVELKDSRFKY